MNNTLKTALLYLLVLAALIPAACVRDFDFMNELRYLSIADESISEGHIICFYNQGEPYADKPPLYLWLVTLCRLIFGQHLLPVLTLLSVIPAVVTSMAMARICRRSLSGSMGLASQMMLLSTGLFVALMFTLRMDMMMTMWIVLALGVFLRHYEKGQRLSGAGRFWFPVLVFLAVFTKGPVGILLPLLGTVAFLLWERRLKLFGRFWGWSTWGILLLLCALWWGAVYLEGGQEYIYNLLVKQTAGRAVNSFHHARPFWYYCTNILWVLLPWTPLIIGVWAVTLRERGFKTAPERLMVATAVAGFVMLSCFSSKLAVYLLPLVPFIIFATASNLSRRLHEPWVRWCIAVPAILFLLMYPASFIAPYFGQPLPAMFKLAAFILSAGGAYSCWRLLRSRTVYAIHGIGIALFAAVFAAGFEVDFATASQSYGEVSRAASEMAARERLDKFYTYRLKRAENIDVYLGGRDVVVLPQDSTVAVTDGVVMLPASRADSLALPVKASATAGKFVVVTLQQQ